MSRLFDFYNYFARSYLFSKENIDRRKWEFGLLEKWINGSKILDLAGGGGVLAHVAQKKGYDVVLADLAFELVTSSEVDKKICCDAKYLPFKESSFDVILFWGNPYPHFSIIDFHMCLLEVKRVLKKGGRFITAVFDFVKLGVERNYKMRLDEGDHYSIQKSFDPLTLKVERQFVSRDRGIVSNFEFYLWSPAFVEACARIVGLRRLEARTYYEDKSWLIVYEK